MNLRAIRKQKQLTQVELSRLSGVPQPVISMLETGRHDAPWVKKLAEALGVSESDIRGSQVSGWKGDDE